MIGYMEGTLKGKRTTSALVLTSSGVGYELILPPVLLAELPDAGGAVSFYVVTIVREAEITLYGMGGLDEKTMFEQLITVSGIGPKAALAFISAFSPGQLRSAIVVQDVGLLSTIPGIGKKTASRLCIELGDKLGKDPTAWTDAGGGAGRAGELFSALTNLGFPEKDVQNVIKNLPPKPEELSERIRLALSQLGKH